MLEVELKFPVADLASLKQRLIELGAQPGDTLDEQDHYFNAPDRDFAITDEALRIRQEGADVCITYKGPKLDKVTKTRTEIELPLAGEVEHWSELLKRLGYRPVASVRKQRTPLTLKRGDLAIQVVLDELEGVGTYAELEIVAEDSQRERATETILELAKELRLGQSERRSYLEMHLARRGVSGEATIVVETVAKLRRALASHRQKGQRIGLVPTMGALHAGHASLIRAAAQETDCVVVSIFVNPTQFGPNEDLRRYPRTLDADLAICKSNGAHVVFVPSMEEMYPPGDQTIVEVTELQKPWEGASRPGHFRGVATVVAKLFNQVQPDVAYFGQKDAQQARIIQEMVRDLHFPVAIRVCPIVREPDGLALSSRNRYLSPEDRQKATVLHRALERAKELVTRGETDARAIQAEVEGMIRASPGVLVDYLAIVDSQTLQPVARIAVDGQVLLAIRVGGTRLIDNARLTPS